MAQDELVTFVEYWYDKEAIRQIILTTSLQNVYSQGKRDSKMQRMAFELGPEFPLLGFYGTWVAEEITSLGLVVANATCVPDGVYRYQEESGLSGGAIAGIVVGSLLFVAGCAGGAYLGYRYGIKQKLMQLYRSKRSKVTPQPLNTTDVTNLTNESRIETVAS